MVLKYPVVVKICYWVLPIGRILLYPSVEVIPVISLYHFKNYVIPNRLQKVLSVFFFPFHTDISCLKGEWNVAPLFLSDWSLYKCPQNIISSPGGLLSLAPGRLYQNSFRSVNWSWLPFFEHISLNTLNRISEDSDHSDYSLPMERNHV